MKHSPETGTAAPRGEGSGGKGGGKQSGVSSSGDCHVPGSTETGMNGFIAGPLVGAAQWLIDTGERPKPLVPELQRRFGLTPKQACDAIRAANAVARSAGIV